MPKLFLAAGFYLMALSLHCSAFSHLEKIVSLGVRQPKSPGCELARTYITKELATLDGCQVIKDSFYTMLGGKLQMGVNILARLNPKVKKRVLLCTHYDTRFAADNDTLNPNLPVVGANDGASGSAALLTLAAKFAQSKLKFGLDFAFFDLEDQGDKNSSNGWILGSKNYADKIEKDDYQLVILLDMVAGKRQKFCQEKFAQLSAPEVNKLFWQTANFSYDEGRYICDDHLPFLLLGIPTIAVIGYPFSHHHTNQDIVKNCSPATLNIVVAATYRFLVVYHQDQHNSK